MYICGMGGAFLLFRNLRQLLSRPYKGKKKEMSTHIWIPHVMRRICLVRNPLHEIVTDFMTVLYYKNVCFELVAFKQNTLAFVPALLINCQHIS